MDGFFSKKDTQSKSRPDGKVYSCTSCGLYKNCNSPRMQPYGEFKKKILIIGEAPGEREDTKGKPWQSVTGRLLRKTLEELGVDLFDDCLSMNAINCRPRKNAFPSAYEIDCCRMVIVQKAIEKHKPKLILLLGNSSIQSLIGSRWKGNFGTIDKWRGWTIPDQEYGCWICPTLHPTYVAREDSKIVNVVWKQDLKKALETVHIPFPVTPKPNIQYLEDLSKLERYQSDIHECAFDYETTGLKPQAEGHQIVSNALTISEELTFAFLMPESKKGRKPFTSILTNPTILKYAHHMKYEDHWSEYRLRITIQGWAWDSMLAAHMMDNRRGVTGLKFQTYVNFGIIDYASEVTPWLQSPGKGGNNLNRVLELVETPKGKKMLLKYDALDSFYQFLLAKKQIKEMDYDFLPF